MIRIAVAALSAYAFLVTPALAQQQPTVPGAPTQSQQQQWTPPAEWRCPADPRCPRNEAAEPMDESTERAGPSQRLPRCPSPDPRCPSTENTSPQQARPRPD